MAIERLEHGTVIGNWTVRRLLGEGGFGAVYQATKVNANDRSYALKLEPLDAQPKLLQMEVLVLNTLQRRGGRHFCRIEERGRFRGFNYVVMTMVGQSLHDLRKARPIQHFSMGTAISCGIQCLEAIEDLHNIGYLHRDIKPANYTVGRPEIGELRKVYILDFGMARRYVNDQNIMRRPRERAGFRGTVRYAPIACHNQMELSRKDDVEGWFYTLIELTTGFLPWKNIQETRMVAIAKNQVRANPQELLQGCPREYLGIMRHVDSLKYYDPPNYAFIYASLRRAMTNTKSREFPYDWEGRVPR